MNKYHFKKRRNSLTPAIIVWLVLFLTLAGFLGWKFYNVYSAKKANQASQNLDTAIFYHPSVPPAETDSNSPAATTNLPPVLPPNAFINMAFSAQAPSANWDALHEDACEEASFLMVKHYLDKTPLGAADQFDAEIQAMTTWENQNDYGPSITAEQLAQIAKDHYNLTGQVKTATVTNIEADIAAGHPVIVPAAGKLLGNPNFRQGGPNYHMLLIKGYDATNFITNDPGTRKGQGYIYTQTTLMNAIHDWDATNILNGPAVYLVF